VNWKFWKKKKKELTFEEAREKALDDYDELFQRLADD
jgi:hypothetical protein